MANKLYEEANIQAIAAAIRTKGGTSNTLTVAQMADAISAISGGGGVAELFGVTSLDDDIYISSGVTITDTTGEMTIGG